MNSIPFYQWPAATSLMQADETNARYDLFDVTALPNACSFLWNPQLVVQINGRGYATAQFMQPEPAKYAHPPLLEAKTFMQPEQPFFAHHPGRFVYIKDEDSGLCFAAPYEPVRQKAARFCFSVGQSDVCWHLQQAELQLSWQLTLSPNQPHELWQLQIQNLGAATRHLSIYPYFPVGYMSWMNQSARFEPSLNALVCRSISPYQKYPDYFKQQHFKDLTFLLSEQIPDSYQANQWAFEGEGGLATPAGLQTELLQAQDADYETPCCVLQYRLSLPPAASQRYRLVFGPAHDLAEIAAARLRYFGAAQTANHHTDALLTAGTTPDTFSTLTSAAVAVAGTGSSGSSESSKSTEANTATPPDGFAQAAADYQAYIQSTPGCLQISTPEPRLDNFVNQWLGRQVFYHGATNRLTTDPQTRNFLQDHMGMSYLQPASFAAALCTALSQQHHSGEMPDGILLHAAAELKYINQVPHTDQCVWLPICLSAYLAETDDYALLQQLLPFRDHSTPVSIFTHIEKAMHWLLQKTDSRGLSYIEQGDWCDPMNMVGYKGRGVSGWLSLASAYALQQWAAICIECGQSGQADYWHSQAERFNQAMNQHLWDGQWFGRGITDDNLPFGIAKDVQGQIYLNPQSFALLSGAASGSQQQLIYAAVAAKLATPYGLQMLAPAYQHMREDVGRLTQKFPGSAENGSVYNHAVTFYLFALYQQGQAEQAFGYLMQLLPGLSEADQRQRGQLPVFIPNYYRGAYAELPRTAGRSSQLFNTGTVHWLYRILVEQLFGLKGCRRGLLVQPQLPAHWSTPNTALHIQRRFRGATFDVKIQHLATINAPQLWQDGKALPDCCVTDFQAGGHYQLLLQLPLQTVAA